MSNFDWFLKRVYEKNEKRIDTGEWRGGFYSGDDSDNFADGSTDDRSTVLSGNKGNDILVGNNDILNGGAGNDTLISLANIEKNQSCILNGGDGNDRMIAYGGPAFFIGGTGNNLAVLSDLNNGSDTIELDIDGLIRIRNFDSSEDKLSLFFARGDFNYSTGSDHSNGDLFLDNNNLMLQASSGTKTIASFIGDTVTLTADNFRGI